jgi:hypothetical protein
MPDKKHVDILPLKQFVVHWSEQIEELLVREQSDTGACAFTCQESACGTGVAMAASSCWRQASMSR